jgi:FO synthase
VGGLTNAALLAMPEPELLAAARGRRDARHGRLTSYSPKVFIPLTKLCRDVCHYCTFAAPPKRGQRAYMTEQEVLDVARAGSRAGCLEALFTLGDKPELRYAAARRELEELGCETTVDYLARMCRVVLEETGLLPHVNAGVLSREELELLRGVSASAGLMLESSASRLSERGGPHFGSPDKDPVVRLATIEHAGELQIPFTTGLLIGIGETREERLDGLRVIAESHARHGHVQEVIIQNFRAKPGTLMHAHPEPTRDDLAWTIAAARLLLGPDVHIQSPPNLTEDFGALLDAGLDDWGGVSPVTVDHVNPEAPWPDVARLCEVTEAHGRTLVRRLCVYPEYVDDLARWVDPAVGPAVRAAADGEGWGRDDGWVVGATTVLPPTLVTGASRARATPIVDAAIARLADGEVLEDDLVTLLHARGHDVAVVAASADRLRREVCGDTVTYVVTRNINYTNVCYFRCGFCAFSKGRLAENLRGPAYVVPVEEVVRRSREAWERGAVEVCLQGGIHPGFTGDTYAEILEAVKAELPDLHVHAFSALEVWQGAETLGTDVPSYLTRLKSAGLGSLPGTAAEILDDEVRALLCPDKINTAQWLSVHDAAHAAGLPTTSTMMFGAVEGPRAWARHLLRIREQQVRSGGFTEFVPLPFVHTEAPIFRRGKARRGPTFREALLLHAVARLALHPVLTNIQASWVKLGPRGVAQVLAAGANDIGGTLMNESISRAAGAEHGQELPPEGMDALIAASGRRPRQRTTLYGEVHPERRARSYGAAPLAPVLDVPAREAGLVRPARLARAGV